MRSKKRRVSPYSPQPKAARSKYHTEVRSWFMHNVLGWNCNEIAEVEGGYGQTVAVGISGREAYLRDMDIRSGLSHRRTQPMGVLFSSELDFY